MIDTVLGHRMSFPIQRFDSLGAHLLVDPLDVGDEAPTVFLPADEVPEDAQVGDRIEAFVYLDTDEQPLATTRPPKLALGEVAFLTITAVTQIGAFVDWGLGKELLVPYAEQSRDLNVGEIQPIGLYLDKTGRLAGTMFVNDMLRPPPRGIRRDEWIEGEAWRNEPEIGLFAILDRSYVGLVPASEPHRLSRGQPTRFRVAHVLPDGKLVLSLRQHAHKERSTDEERILDVLSRPGSPRVGDKSDPDLIRDLFGLSKKAFKRAVGGLLKSRKIDIDDRGYIVVVP